MSGETKGAVDDPRPAPEVVLGERVRAMRTEQRYTQRELSERAGMHWTYLAQVERGERDVSLSTILKMARGLGVDAGALLKGLMEEANPHAVSPFREARRKRAAANDDDDRTAAP